MNTNKPVIGKHSNVQKGIRRDSKNKKYILIELLTEDKQPTGHEYNSNADANDKNKLGHIYQGDFDFNTGKCTLNKKVSYGAWKNTEDFIQWTALQNASLVSVKKETAYRKDYLDDLETRLYKERKAYADAKKRGDYATMGAIRELLFTALTK